MQSFRVFFEMAVPPHMPHLWWRTTKQKAKELEDMFIGKKDLFDKADKLADEYGFDSPRDVYYELDYNFRGLGDSYTDPLSKRMEEYENLPQEYKERGQKRLDIITDNQLDFKRFTKAYINYYKRPDNYYDYSLEQIEDDKNAKYILESCKEVLRAILEYIKLLKSTHDYISAIKERNDLTRQTYTWDKPKKTMPDHKPIETLYHATPFMKEILSGGFKTKKEAGIEALGGDTQDAISFTSDLQIAKEIVRSLIEAINIAHGKFNIGHIIKLAKSEGINTKKFEDWISTMQWRSMKQQVRTGKKKGLYTPSELEPSRYDDIKYVTFELYKEYLAKSDLRYNPLFFGIDINNFAKMDVNNVGVLACQVQMDTVIRYLHGMEEYRVPINGILSTRQV